MKTEGSNGELKTLEHLGLRFNPFPVSPDVDNFFLSRSIDLLITEIVHGILTRKGFMVLTGEIGLGKTTISRKIIHVLEEEGVETSLVFHTSYQNVELLKEINRDFGLEDQSLHFGDQMRLLNDFLVDQNGKGKNCAIIIDDAQNLNNETLELVRMISNLETDQQKLVQILLIGQPELFDKLNLPDLRQLKSRIIIQKEANPLNVEEVSNYLLFKLNAAGNKGRTTIKKDAVKKVHQITRGNFRQINILMDRCLYAAFLHNTMEISKTIVKEAHNDLSVEKSRPWKRTLVWSGATLVILLIFGGVIYSRSYLPISFIDSVRRFLPKPLSAVTKSVEQSSPSIVSSSAEIGAAPIKVKQSIEQSAVPQEVEVQRVERETGIPGSVADFLRVYGLSDYVESFFEALKTNRIQEIAERIFERSGNLLIRFDDMPGHVRENFGILAYPSEPGESDAFFLFWRPSIRLTTFYYGYAGEEIRVLQEMLAAKHFYKDRIDGIVGRNLMKAIIRFQKQSALPVTGFPDEKTIFLLWHPAGGDNPL